jgi:chemotaxis protein MotB
VVRLFVASGVDAARLTASGYADNRPVESNDTPDGRARNRRVTLLIIAGPADGGGNGGANGNGSGA